MALIRDANPALISAREIISRRRVVIKIYPRSRDAEYVQNEAVNAVFLRLSLRDHELAKPDNTLYKRVWKVYGHGEFYVEGVGITYCLIAEFIPGESLGSFCERASREGKSITFEQWIRLARKVFHLISEMHNIGVTHNGIIPRAIFIREGATFDDISDNFVLTEFDDSVGENRAESEMYQRKISFRSVDLIGFRRENAHFRDWLLGLDPEIVYELFKAEDVYAASMVLFNLIANRPLSKLQKSIEKTARSFRFQGLESDAVVAVEMRNALRPMAELKSLMKNFAYLAEKSAFSKEERKKAKALYKAIVAAPFPLRRNAKDIQTALDYDFYFQKS